MSTTPDFNKCLQAFNDAATECVAYAVRACYYPTSNGPLPTTAAFGDNLRAIYGRHMKPFLENQPAELKDPRLDRAIGNCYGSLFAQLLANFARYAVLHDTPANTLIDMQQVSADCSRDQIGTGATHVREAAVAVTTLMQQWAMFRSKADMLAKLLEDYCEKKKVRYHYYKGSTRDEYSGHSIISIGAMKQTWNKIGFEFLYCDGVDYCSIAISELFETSEQRERVQALARMVFGTEVKFSADFNSIEV